MPEKVFKPLMRNASVKNSSFKNSYLPNFPDEIVEMLAVFLSKSYWTLLCSILLLIVLSRIVMDYLMVKLYGSPKMKMVL